MKIKKIIVGPLKANCYIVYDESIRKGVIIDPGGSSDKIIKSAKGLKIPYILNTHGHFDHIIANGPIKKHFKAKIAITTDDSKMITSYLKNYSFILGFARVKSPKAELLLSDRQLIKVNNLKFKVIIVPGHTKGSAAYLINNHLFTGDILFKGAHGMTLNRADGRRIIKGIKEKILVLPGNTIVHPGHEGDTTIAEERKRYV